MKNNWIKTLIETSVRADLKMPWAAENGSDAWAINCRKRASEAGGNDA